MYCFDILKFEGRSEDILFKTEILFQAHNRLLADRDRIGCERCAWATRMLVGKIEEEHKMRATEYKGRGGGGEVRRFVLQCEF